MGYNKHEIWARTGKPHKKKLGTTRLKRRLFGDKKAVPCPYCGKRLTPETATFDHVEPKSQGGYHKAKNGELVCQRCNNLKGAMSKGTFLQMIREGKITL